MRISRTGWAVRLQQLHSASFRNPETKPTTNTEVVTEAASSSSGKESLQSPSASTIKELDVLIAQCRATDISDRISVFGNRERRLHGMLPAYRLFRLVSAHPGLEPLLREAYHQRAARKRELKNKLSLLTLYVALTPQSKLEHRICSDISPMLDYAAYHDVLPADFCAWAATIPFEVAAKAIRERRRAETPGTPEPPVAPPSSFPGSKKNDTGLEVPFPVTGEEPDGVKLTISLIAEGGELIASSENYITSSAANNIERAMRELAGGAFPLACAITDILDPDKDASGRARDRPNTAN